MSPATDPTTEPRLERVRSAELRALLLLRLLPGVGDRTAVRLLRAQGSARDALALSTRAFSDAAGAEAAAARNAPELGRRVEWILRRCAELGIRPIRIGEEDYPARLLALSDPPPLLFLRGDATLLDRRSAAIVGSRRASPVGRRAAERLGREISEAGVTVVSGLALGIDSAAHRGGLAGAGGTIAVLGSGPERAHPPGNRPLFRRVLDEGLVVSEFPPGEPARPFHFPRRNRILAALSRAVVVVEAERRSGALITVDHALDLGLEVFAVPGSVEMPQSEGTNRLLRDGAHLLTRGSELLEVLGWDPAPAPLGNRGAASASGAPSTAKAPRGRSGRAMPDPDGGAVRASLREAPRSVDELVGETGLSVSRVLAALTRLEVAGVASRTGAGWALAKGGR